MAVPGPLEVIMLPSIWTAASPRVTFEVSVFSSEPG